MLIVGKQNQSGLARRVTECLDPGRRHWIGESLLGAKETASLCRRPRTAQNTTVKSSTATPQPRRRSTGSLEKRPRVPSMNMIKQMLLDHSFNVSQELCFTRGSTASHAAGTSIHSAGTMPLVQKSGLVFFSRLPRWKRCWDFRTLSCGMALITGLDQIWWTSRHIVHPARRGEAPPRAPSASRHPQLRSEAPHTWRGSRISRKKGKCCLMMETSQPLY